MKKDKKEILYKNNAYKKILSGTNKVLEAITPSFGPLGSLVAIEKGKDRSPQLTNDGITIAKSIDLNCPFENMACQILKDIGDKVNEDVGDGTTSAMILSGEIFKNGIKAVVSADIDRNVIIKGLEKGFDILFSSLEKYRRDLYFEDIDKVAFASSRSDEISLLIKKAYEKIGAKGLITPDVSNSAESGLEIKSGAEYEIKNESIYLLDKENESVLHNPYILVTNINIDNIRKLVPILTKIKETGRRALIISQGCSQEVLGVLVANKQQGGIRVSTCKMNVAVPDRELSDVSVLVGAKFLDNVLDINFRDLELSDLGSAEKIILKKDKLIIINGKSNKEELEQKIHDLNKSINDAPSSFDKEKLSERLSRLTGGTAVIRLGAHTESELKEKKMRLEDALSATQSALVGGVVKGGCSIYLSLLRDLEAKRDNFTIDERLSYNIIVDSLKNLYISLMNNSSLNGDIMLYKAMEMDENLVYDIISNKFVDFEKEGMVESYLCIKSILQRSKSIVKALINSDVLVAIKK